jgi:hypothetical protein
MKSAVEYSEWSKDCYSEDFKDYLSPFTKALTGKRCVLCGDVAKTTHHAFYTQGGLEDKPGFNLFPVCAQHHGEAHASDNWIVIYTNHPTKGRITDPVSGRYNNETFYRRLAAGWEEYVLPTSQWEEAEAKFFRPRRNKPAVVVKPKYDEVDDQNLVAGLVILLAAIGLIAMFLL